MMALFILSLSVLEDIVNLLLGIIGKGGTGIKQSREKKANYHIQTTQARNPSQSCLLSFQSLSYEYSYPIVRVININEGCFERASVLSLEGKHTQHQQKKKEGSWRITFHFLFYGFSHLPQPNLGKRQPQLGDQKQYSSSYPVLESRNYRIQLGNGVFFS